LCGELLPEQCKSSDAPSEPNVSKPSRKIDPILYLFSGAGSGIGFAATALIKWVRISKRCKIVKTQQIIKNAEEYYVLFPNNMWNEMDSRDAMVCMLFSNFAIGQLSVRPAYYIIGHFLRRCISQCYSIRFCCVLQYCQCPFPKNLFVFTHIEIMNDLQIKRMVKMDFE
jgi:hypothetical protein